MKKLSKPPRGVPKVFSKNTEKAIDKDAVIRESWEVPNDSRPSMRITSQQVPEIVDWKVGESYPMEVNLELVSLEKIEGPKGEYYYGSFRVSTYNTGESE